MSDPAFSLTADDDLPRTIRREREAREREREAREREAQAFQLTRERNPPAIEPDGDYAQAAPAATVADIDVPFVRLMMFFIKAVFAAIPAMIVLTAFLWLAGQALQSFFPQLLKMKIDVQVYSPQSAADFRSYKERR
jgi:hypothetical protein